MVSDDFPAGLRVLVVDDDRTCLKILSKMLGTFRYKVTTCDRAEDALALLRSDGDRFDVVLSEVHLTGMNGIELLERVGLEMDVPVILMSGDGDMHLVMKGVTQGACDYLIKPIRMEQLRNIWQHVVRKRMRRDDRDDEGDNRLMPKNPSMVWSIETHQQFIAAVNQLGIDKAVPAKITELMNVPGLTSEDVARHLQKYGIYLKIISSTLKRQAGENAPSVVTHRAASGTIPSPSRVDPLAPAANHQPPAAQILAKPGPAQRGNVALTGCETKLWLGEAKQSLLNGNGSKEASILNGFGIPAEMLESKRLCLALLLLSVSVFVFVYGRSGFAC